MLSKLKLSTRILSTGIIIIICFSLVFVYLFLRAQDEIYNAKYEQTQRVVESAWSITSYYADLAKQNKMTVDDAKKNALETLRSIRFAEDDYVYVTDLNCIMLMNPVSTELENKDASDTKDTNGVRIVAKAVEIARNEGSGFFNYNWKKANATQASPKNSYVKLFNEWDWVIVAGVYVDDVQKDISSLLYLMLTVGLIIIVGGMLLCIFMSRSIYKPILENVGNLDESAQQVASASEQLSSTSQQLAEGNSEQAASIEETSATLEESASMIQQNSQNTKQAALLAGQTKASADKGSSEMDEMMTSMTEIKKSSDQIAKIIKVIDDIAFQTNILALNAAVEAARAGDAGMGFAVVAEEVRNLAQRSAQAAKDTAGIIESNIELSEKGVNVAKRVGESLAEITLQAKKVNELMDEIAAASQEQTQGISQITKAITQMEKVTQMNASNAEESAAASEELAAQAENMKDVVDLLFKLVNGSSDINTNSRNLSGNKKVNNFAEKVTGSSKLDGVKSNTARLTAAATYNDTKREVRKTHIVNPEEIIPLNDDSQDF
jgi:Methyl-accepting chemotaxis protein